MYYCYGKGVQKSVLCREVVPFLEGPLSEVLRTVLHKGDHLYSMNICRYLLGFGRVSQYVGYNAMDDFFPTMAMKPNPQCSSSHCRLRQEEHRKYLEAHPLPVEQEEVVKDEVVHDDNEWGKHMYVCR